MNEALENIKSAIDKAKGQDTMIFKVNEHHPDIDYVVITSASNQRQLLAIADYVRDVLIDKNYGYSHMEGNDTSKWILVDSDLIVIHVFEEQEREVYSLEKLYANCERVM